MESAKRILTISEVAEVLRCSKAHVHKALTGSIAGVPQLAHLNLGAANSYPKTGSTSGCGYPLTYLAAFTGVRRNEALALRFDDVEWFTNEVNVRHAISKRRRKDGGQKWE